MYIHIHVYTYTHTHKHTHTYIYIQKSQQEATVTRQQTPKRPHPTLARTAVGTPPFGCCVLHWSCPIGLCQPKCVYVHMYTYMCFGIHRFKWIYVRNIFHSMNVHAVCCSIGFCQPRFVCMCMCTRIIVFICMYLNAYMSGIYVCAQRTIVCVCCVYMCVLRAALELTYWALPAQVYVSLHT
jgi:hypothetical protein